MREETLDFNIGKFLSLLQKNREEMKGDAQPPHSCVDFEVNLHLPPFSLRRFG